MNADNNKIIEILTKNDIELNKQESELQLLRQAVKKNLSLSEDGDEDEFSQNKKKKDKVPVTSINNNNLLNSRLLGIKSQKYYDSSMGGMVDNKNKEKKTKTYK